MLESHSDGNEHFQVLGRSAENTQLCLDEQRRRSPGSDQLLPRENIACACVCACACTCVLPSLAPHRREMFSIPFPVSVSPSAGVAFLAALL